MKVRRFKYGTLINNHMAKKNYEDLGTICIEECDDANIPVNCFLTQIKPGDEDYAKKYHGWFAWYADNFMPRKQTVDTGRAFEILARKKQTILSLVTKYVVPLYEAALANLKSSGGNYYWKKSEFKLKKKK